MIHGDILGDNRKQNVPIRRNKSDRHLKGGELRGGLG